MLRVIAPVLKGEIMKQVVLFLTLVLGMTLKSQAVNVSDIDAIVAASYELANDADRMLRFALKLRELRDQGFEFTVADSTQTVTITNVQKQGLLVRYNELKTKLQNDIGQLP